MRLAFIGLGVMGRPMAQNLLRNGVHELAIYDIDSAPVKSLAEMGARAADSIADAITGADMVLTSLPGPPQIDAVAFAEDGLFANFSSDTVWIDLSTNNLETGERIRQRAEQDQIAILDAPVSGGDEGARAGNLTILVGGEAAVYARCLPVLEILGENISLIGASGAGYSAKIAQVVLCYLHSLALSEALMLGVKGGVEVKQMLSIIQHSTGKSYVADRYGPSILNGDYDPSFSLGLALKDMKLAQEMAGNLGISLPMCDLATATYARAVETYGFEANHLKAVRLLEEDNHSFLQTPMSKP